jgi:hypothetical protein
MMSKSAAQTKGEQALKQLEDLVNKRWHTLNNTEKASLDAWSAERFLWRLQWELRRLGGEPLLRVPARSVAQRYRQVRLLHLRPEGPAAQREAKGLTSKESLIVRRVDDRDTALSHGRGSFDLRELRALQRTAQQVRADLHKVLATALAKHHAKHNAWLRALSRGLNWYSKRFLTLIIRDARSIKTRDRLDSRAIVTQLVKKVEIVTGQRRLQLLSDILNWRAPRPTEDWTPRLLSSWLREDRRQRAGQAAGRDISL